MAEGKQREEWGRLSAWMALFANCNRDSKKSEPYTPAAFDPFTKREPRQKLNKTDSVRHLSALIGARKEA